MRRSILIVFGLLLSVFFPFSISTTGAQNVDFEVLDTAPGWTAQVFLTIYDASPAAIAFDSKDNLYYTDIWPFGAGEKTIYRLNAPEYLGPPEVYSTYLTAYEVISGLDFDDKSNLFASEVMGSGSGSDAGAIRKVQSRTVGEDEIIVFPDFRPTGIAAIGKGALYFSGRKWSDEEWGNVYSIDSFIDFDPTTEPIVVRANVVLTALAIDSQGNLYGGSRYPDNSVYTRNPYTGESVQIARFNQYVEELSFGPGGDLYALEDPADYQNEDDPSTIIRLIPPHVVIYGCDTGIIEWPLPGGSTISALIEDECRTAVTHGDFVNCVVNVAQELKSNHYITAKEMGAIIHCAANSDARAGAKSAYLKQGWDSFDHPLKQGKVILNQPSSGMFQVTYILAGALPNHTYQVGVHLFPTPANEWWDDFGSEGWEDNLREREEVCRYDDFPEGWVEKCSPLNAWEFGFLTTDDCGDGAAHFNLHPNSGTFEVQFNVRNGICTEQDNSGCGVVFESGGPFTTTETVTISE